MLDQLATVQRLHTKLHFNDLYIALFQDAYFSQ